MKQTNKKPLPAFNFYKLLYLLALSLGHLYQPFTHPGNPRANKGA